jgi:integrase
MNFKKSSKQRKLPTVLTQNEMRSLLSTIDPKYALLAKLMYGSGLRLMEAIRLRVQDIDFDHLALSIWNAKGGKNRRVTLARELKVELEEQILKVEKYHQFDSVNTAYVGVKLPFALSRKYPNAPYEVLWHFLFPSHKLSLEPSTNNLRRHHINETSFQKALKKASV